MAEKLYWIDDRMGIKIGDKVYVYGEVVPMEKLSKRRQEKFADCVSKHNPNKKPKKVKKAEGK